MEFMYVTYCVILVVIPGFSPFLLTVMILDGGVGGNSRFFDHVTCPLFLPQPDERGVPEPIVRRPFGKLDLRNGGRFKPATFLHLLGCDSLTP